jgi:hypothetical protein
MECCIGELLSLLSCAIEAPFNAYQRRHDPVCLPDTRVDLLRDIYNWADGQDGRCIFWLNGLAGTGKSTIARTVARNFSDQKRLGASFFFSRGGGDVGHAGKFVTSIALQLASNSPSLDQHICNALAERRDIVTQSLHDQWQQLVLVPLSKLGRGGGPPSSLVLVVDALDECDDENDVRTIIRLLAEARSLKPVRFRVFLTSRPEVPIRYGLGQMSESEHQDFVLHNISPSIVDHDIRTFLEYSFQTIAQERSFVAGWPGEDVINCFVQSASGLFIWAATACRFIREGKRFAAKRLNIILENSSIDTNAAEEHLNKIYTTVLHNCISPEYSDGEKQELRSMTKYLLGSIATSLSPLSTQSLSKLLGTAQDNVDQTLNDLHAILSIPADRTLPLRLHHPSFRDFLYQKTRSEDFWVDERQAHEILAYRCIKLMSSSLEQDICGVDAPGAFVADVRSSRVQESLLPEVQYACLYWIQHVEKSGISLYDNGQVHCFLTEHFLHWLEALGWMGKISEGVHAITALESFISVSISSGRRKVFANGLDSLAIVQISRCFSMTRNGSCCTIER